MGDSHVLFPITKPVKETVMFLVYLPHHDTFRPTDLVKIFIKRCVICKRCKIVWMDFIQSVSFSLIRLFIHENSVHCFSHKYVVLLKKVNLLSLTQHNITEKHLFYKRQITYQSVRAHQNFIKFEIYTKHLLIFQMK